MRYILTILTFWLLFMGCADKNAFSKFNMQPDQELGAASLQGTKIKNGDNVEGIFSAIYLNKVYPNVYTVNEYFYVYHDWASCVLDRRCFILLHDLSETALHHRWYVYPHRFFPGVASGYRYEYSICLLGILACQIDD